MNGVAGNSGMVTILGFLVHAYPILVTAGIVCGGLVATYLARGNVQDAAHVWRALISVCLWSIVGGRLWFVLFPPLSYIDNGITAGWMLTHFFDLNVGAVAIWAGGLGLFGALPFGAFALARYTRRHGLPVALWLDIAAVTLPLAQAVARIGNGINLDLYGPPTTSPWGMLVNDSAQRVGPYTDLSRYPLDTTRFQPVYLYELILAAAIFIALMVIFTRFYDHWQAGDMGLLYILFYGTGRFLLESMRVNVSLVGTVDVSQLVAGIAALVALGVLIRRHGATAMQPAEDLA